MNPAGVVFNIQRFSVHDGPGIRTTVFLKGCGLSCFWCHNPEGRHPFPEIQFFPDRCIACRACVEACPHAAHEFVGDVHVFHRDRCEVSGTCVETCYSRALQVDGSPMGVDEVLEEILHDRPFYEASGGGVTLSGGEPTLHGDFARAILAECKSHSLHTAIETCGDCPWESLEELLPLTDLIMMDIKHLDAHAHREATGRSNERILDNARRLALTVKPLVFRTPVVPTVNDAPEVITAIASFVHGLHALRKKNLDGRTQAGISFELLSFHKLASEKYRSLGMEYRASGIDPLPREQMRVLAEAAGSVGLETRVR